MDAFATLMALAGLSGGSGGTSDHAELSNLDYANSGHTGFASSAALSAHTDNSNIHVTANDKATWNAKQDGVTVKTTLDSPLVASTIYNLGSISTLSLSLPTSDVTPAQAIIVRFTASAAFAVSITGTVAGETSLTTVSGKTYELAFTGNTSTGWWLESRYI